MWGLSSPIRDRTPAVEGGVLITGLLGKSPRVTPCMKNSVHQQSFFRIWMTSSKVDILIGSLTESRTSDT